MKKTLDWDIETIPVRVKENVLTNWVAISRNDTGAILSVRSQKYKPFKNKDLHRLVERIKSRTNYELVGYQDFRKGRRVIAYLKLNSENLPKGSSKLSIGKSETNDFLLIGNAHDGSSALFLAYTNVLLRCENQFTLPMRLFGKEHRESIHFTEDSIEKVIRDFHEEREKIYELMNGWRQQAVPEGLIDRLICHLFPNGDFDKMPIEIREKRAGLMRSIELETNELGSNFWGLFNGVTHFTTPRSSGSLFGNPYSVSSRLNAKAIEFLTSESHAA